VQAARSLGISFGDMPEGDCPFTTPREIEHRFETVEAALGEAVGV
jgi:hypothetical protein